MEKEQNSPVQSISNNDNIDISFDKSPTCCELISSRAALFVTALLQTILLSLFIIAFISMESNGFFHMDSPLRFIITIICSFYLFSIICTIIGGIFRLESALLLSTHLLHSFILFTDLIAVSVVICMAIGNRNEWIYALPSKLVKEDRFEKFLGPFWMYLSAISLHITVAANMCFLQSINHYMGSLNESIDRRL